MRDVTYCPDCGARMHLYVIGVCARCNFDRTGEDEEADARDAREGAESAREDERRW
jgi:hypothetical protein